MVQTRNSLFRQRCSSLSKSKAFQLFFIINTWFLINLNFNSFTSMFYFHTLVWCNECFLIRISIWHLVWLRTNISLWNVESNRYFVIVLSLKTWFPSIFYIYISAPSFWTFLQCKTKYKKHWEKWLNVRGTKGRTQNQTKRSCNIGLNFQNSSLSFPYFSAKNKEQQCFTSFLNIAWTLHKIICLKNV